MAIFIPVLIFVIALALLSFSSKRVAVWHFTIFMAI